MTIYSLYGITLASERVFITPLMPATGQPELTFTCVDEAPLVVDWNSQQPRCSSPHQNGEGASIWQFYQFAEWAVVRCPRIADFYLRPTAIHCHRCPITPEEQWEQEHWLEIRLLGTVFAFWLEQRGMPVLHAAAVATPYGAVAFLAASGSGKSTLASAFVGAGYPLLTDDNLAIRQEGATFRALPGYPQMRMWPETATYAVGAYEGLPALYPAGEKRRLRIGAESFGQFCATPQPVAVCYLPERRDPTVAEGAVEISALSPAEALYALVKQAFLFEANQRLGAHQQRLRFWSQFVRQTPVKRLRYPEGFVHLAAVRQAILADLAAKG